MSRESVEEARREVMRLSAACPLKALDDHTSCQHCYGCTIPQLEPSNADTGAEERRMTE